MFMNTSRNAARATKTYWKRFRASQFGHISHYWITRESKSLIRIDRPAICFRIRQIKSRSASLDWNRICACRLGSLFVQLQKLKDHMAPHPAANLTFLKQSVDKSELSERVAHQARTQPWPHQNGEAVSVLLGAPLSANRSGSNRSLRQHARSLSPWPSHRLALRTRSSRNATGLDRAPSLSLCACPPP